MACLKIPRFSLAKRRGVCLPNAAEMRRMGTVSPQNPQPASGQVCLQPHVTASHGRFLAERVGRMREVLRSDPTRDSDALSKVIERDRKRQGVNLRRRGSSEADDQANHQSRVSHRVLLVIVSLTGGT